MNDELENILSSIQQKDASVLCREVTSIGDTMDVLRAKWNVEILTAILCGQTRFKDIQEAVHGVSEKVLTERLRQMQEYLCTINNKKGKKTCISQTPFTAIPTGPHGR